MKSPSSEHVTLVEVLELTRPFEEFAAAIQTTARRLEVEGIEELVTLQFYADPGSTEVGAILTFDRDRIAEHIEMITAWEEFERFFGTVRPLDVRVYGKLSAEAEAWMRQFDVVSKTFEDHVDGFVRPSARASETNAREAHGEHPEVDEEGPSKRVLDHADRTHPAVHVGHVHLRVADLERATAFYRDVLGFTVSAYGPDHGLPGAAFLAVGDYHHHIGLNTWTSEGGAPPPTGHTGLHHLAILYPTAASSPAPCGASSITVIPLMGPRITARRSRCT